MLLGAIAQHHECRREIKDMTWASLDALHAIGRRDGITIREILINTEVANSVATSEEGRYPIRDQTTMHLQTPENYLESMQGAKHGETFLLVTPLEAPEA